MSLSTVIEVVIGLSFVFLILSLVASGIKEFFAALLGLRSKTLLKGMKELLGTKDEARNLFSHVALSSLYKGKRLPSYIPTEKFALAVLDRYLGEAAVGPTASKEGITAALQSADLPDAIKQPLELFWRDAKNDMAVFRTHVEGWFNDTMERASGWYRRETQYILLAIGLILAGVLNVSTITLAQRMWTDGPFRAAIAEQAKKVQPPPGKSDDLGAAIEQIQTNHKVLDRLSLPIGWGSANRPSSVPLALAGWFLTGLAAAMGAPFWFDILNRSAGLRSAGTRPQPAKPAGATDEAAQPPPPVPNAGGAT
jgi:hypothetical protein